MIDYQDIATFVSVTSTGYGGDKVVIEQADIAVTFVQATGYQRNNSQEAVTADAVCWVDPEDAFIVANHNRLEGMYVISPLYGIDDDRAWYKVTEVTVNRDHLLSNQIDNIELQLKKTRRIPLVS